MTQHDWDLLSRADQLQHYLDNGHIPIPCPVERYKVSFTIRYAMWLMTLGYLGKTTGEPFQHYEKVNNTVREVFNKPKFLLSSYGRLAVLPYQLIMPDKISDYKPNKSGYFKLTPKGIRFINGVEKIPQTVLFGSNSYNIIGDMITIDQVKKLNFEETLHILKTF